jgi:hypothetical protein
LYFGFIFIASPYFFGHYELVDDADGTKGARLLEENQRHACKNPYYQGVTAAGILVVIILVGVVLWLQTPISSVAQSDMTAKDIVKVSGDVQVEEDEVRHDVVAVGGSVTVLRKGRVTGDAVVIGGNVILKSNARVDGNAIAVAGEIIKEGGATVGGTEVTVLVGDKRFLSVLKESAQPRQDRTSK